MKTLITFILSLLMLATIAGCRTKYIPIPVETVKKENKYIDRWHRDSIYVHDSVFLAHKGDTVFLERYKTLYKERFVRDSIFMTDSVRVEIPYPVEVVTEVNRLHNWQIILMCLGGVLIGYIGFRVIRRVKI